MKLGTLQEVSHEEQASQLLAAIVSSSEDAILSKTLDGTITSWNDSAERLFGYTADEAIGKPITTIIPPDHISEEESILQSIAQGNRFEHYETVRLRKDGTIIPVSLSISPIRDAEGDIIGASSIARDITAQKQAETALRESEERYRATFSDAPVGIAHVGLDGYWLDFNDAVCAITGYSPEELKTMTFGDITHPDDLERDWAQARRLATGQGPVYSIEKRYIRKNGSSVWVSLTVSLLKDAQGKPLNFIAVIQDIQARKKAEAELNERERRLADQARLLDLSNDAIIVRDASSRIVFWNHGSEELYGWRKDDVLGRTSHELFKTEFPEGLESITAKLYEHGRWQGELIHTRRDGSRVVVASRWALDRDSSGRTVSVLEVNRDVTKRKRAEEKLRESEQRLRSALQGAGGGAWDWDLVRDEAWWSPELYELWGIEPGTQMQFRNSFEPIKEEDRDVLRTAIKEAIAQGKDFSCEFRVLHPTRGERWMISHGRVMYDQFNHAARLVGITMDITERKRMEEVLRESEIFYRQTLESIPGLVFTTYPDGYCDYASQQWTEYSGIPIERQLGDGWRQTVHPDDREHARQESAAAIEKGNVYELEYRLRRYDGAYRWFKVRVRPICNAERQIVRWFGVALDIEDLKQAESALEDVKEELIRVNHELERKVDERTAKLQDSINELEHFSYTITHDMRAPLRAMRGFSEILMSESSISCLNPEQREFLRRISDSADRMDNLITDALQYSLLVRGQFHLEPVDSDALLRGILESYPQFHAPNAKIEVTNKLPLVIANKAGLTQCFSNLLGNAVKFVRSGQMPEIRIWAELLEHKTPDDPPQVRICFQDNGIGIDNQYIEKIWKMFHRLNRSYEGTGIGLALVRKAVERMGGTVGVESSPGEGSRFWLDLQEATSDDK